MKKNLAVNSCLHFIGSNSYLLSRNYIAGMLDLMDACDARIETTEFL